MEALPLFGELMGQGKESGDETTDSFLVDSSENMAALGISNPKPGLRVTGL